MQKVSIYPSLINADLLNLKDEIITLEPHCDGFHIDIMDYHFVPNLTWGIPFIHAFSQFVQKPLWIHLMIEKSYDFLQKIPLRAMDIISFHIEAKSNHKKTIDFLREKKCSVSLAINPQTPVDDIFSYLPIVDQVLVMSVNPGFSGQIFIEQTFSKLEKIQEYKKKYNTSLEIAVDGGIMKHNIAQLIRCGVTHMAIASAIFNHQHRVKAIEDLYQEATKSTSTMLS